MGKFVVKLKRHSSSYETDQGEKPQSFIHRCQNSRPTCPPVEEQASGATGSDDSANPRSMYKVNDIGNLWDVLWVNAMENFIVK